MTESFQEVLRYQVTVDDEVGYNFADMVAEQEFIANFIGVS
jgi:hypothetical protein